MFKHPIHTKYSIDSEGNITGPRGKVNPYSIAHKGRRSTYRNIDLAGGYRMSAHRFIWECYHNKQIPEGLVINHIDGNSENNHPCNLEVVTQKENMQHAVDLGLITYKRGGVHHRSKLDDGIVAEIIPKILSGINRKLIAQEYGVSKSTIQDIASRKTWKHVWRKLN